MAGQERKKKSAEDTARVVRNRRSGAQERGLPIEIVTGGSTGTYNTRRFRAQGPHRSSKPARTFSWTWSTGTSAGKSNDHPSTPISAPALTVQTTVISKFAIAHQCTIDAGNKALLKPTDEVKKRAPRSQG